MSVEIMYLIVGMAGGFLAGDMRQSRPIWCKYAFGAAAGFLAASLEAVFY